MSNTDVANAAIAGSNGAVSNTDVANAAIAGSNGAVNGSLRLVGKGN